MILNIFRVHHVNQTWQGRNQEFFVGGGAQGPSLRERICGHPDPFSPEEACGEPPPENFEIWIVSGAFLSCSYGKIH